MAASAKELIQERSEKVDVVNKLTLGALSEEEFSPDPHKARKLAAVLEACGDILEQAAHEPSRRLDARKEVCDVCRRATAVSKIADVLLDDGLDKALQVITEEKQRIQDDEAANIAALPQAKSRRQAGVSEGGNLNGFATATEYDHYNESKSEHVRRLSMDTKALIKRIPDAAAIIIGFGISSIMAGIIWEYLYDSEFSKLLLTIGFGLSAMGQWLSERSLSDGG